MIVAKINVTGANAAVEWYAPVTSGMIGAAVQIGYSEDWQELRKTVVFSGACTKDVITNDTLVQIPKECLRSHGGRMRVGVYGVTGDNNAATPTIWADIGSILPGANPSGDETTDGSLPVYAQILKKADNAENIAKKMAGAAATSAAESARAATEAQNAANRVLEDAAAGRFDGAPGDDGYTPKKGVDYFTPAEVAGIEAGAAAKLEPELSKVKQDIAAVDSAKLTAPESGMEVGKYFRVSSIGEDGKAVLEAVDLPLATKYGEAGLFRALKDYGGFGFVDGEPRIKGADKKTISNRGAEYMPICADSRMDYAVKCAMTDGKGEAWTDAEKVAALQRMGAVGASDFTTFQQAISQQLSGIDSFVHGKHAYGENIVMSITVPAGTTLNANSFTVQFNRQSINADKDMIVLECIGLIKAEIEANDIDLPNINRKLYFQCANFPWSNGVFVECEWGKPYWLYNDRRSVMSGYTSNNVPGFGTGLVQIRTNQGSYTTTGDVTITYTALKLYANGM